MMSTNEILHLKHLDICITELLCYIPEINTIE